MKKTLMFVLSAVMLTGLWTAGAGEVSAQDKTGQMTAEKARRTPVERRVRKEILGLPYYGVFDAIGYQLNGSVVVLNGYVLRPLTRDDAEEAVRDIAGVERVENNIEVLPLSPSDDRIRTRIYRELADTPGLFQYLLGANPAIRIIVKNGDVKLEGFVDAEMDKNLAGLRAREIFGVFGVENNLRVLKRDF